MDAAVTVLSITPPVASATRWWTGRQTVLALCPVAALALIAILLVAYTDHAAQVARQRAAATAQALDRIVHARLVMTAVESAQRGYMLTLSMPYLDAYRSVRARADAAMAALHTDDGGDANGLPAEVQRIADAKLRELDQTVALALKSQPEDALRIVRSDLGFDLMQRLYARLDTMSAREEDKLRENEAQRVRAVTQARVLIYGSGVVDVLICALLLGAMFRSARLEADKARAARSAFEEQFRRQVLAVRDCAMIALDPEGHVVSWNEGAEQILGYTPEEIVGAHFATFYPAHASETGGAATALARVRGDGHALYQDWHIRKDGSRFWADVVLTAHFDAQHRLTGIAKIVRDITDRELARKELQQANAALLARGRELEFVNHELEAFSYSVAHDLRAPLRAIDGFSQALVEDHAAALDEEARGSLSRIRANSARMAELIDDLLSLSRINRAPLHLTTVDLSALATRILQELQGSTPDRVVDVVVAANLRAQADQRLSAVLLQNLLGNAWKFTSRSAAARIVVEMSESKGSVAFCVRDNGAGFDMTYAHKLFTPFQRLHRREEFEGTGIGLATVARICHRHGGAVWAEAEVGRGAAIFFTLASQDGLPAAPAFAVATNAATAAAVTSTTPVVVESEG